MEVSFRNNSPTTLEFATQIDQLVQAPSEVVGEQALAQVYERWTQFLSFSRQPENYPQILELAARPFIQAARVPAALSVQLYAAITFQRQGQSTQARPLAEAVFEMAEERNYLAVRTRVRNLFAVMARDAGNFDLVLKYARETEELAQLANDRESLALARTAIVIAFDGLADPVNLADWEKYLKLNLQDIERNLIERPAQKVNIYLDC